MLVVNKIGDPDYKVAARAVHLLQSLGQYTLSRERFFSIFLGLGEGDLRVI